MKIITFLILSVTGASMAWGQHNVLSVGSAKTLTIKTGTLFSADSLVLTPGSNFTMASNAILETPVPSPGIPNGTIKRVYYLDNPITFTGTIEVYYQLSELNGNTESALKYSDSTIGGWWLVSASSTVNTTSHFVQQAASSRMLISATAAETGTILLLTLVSFTGNLDGDHVGLTWTVDQNEESQSFTVESSPDQQNWKEVVVVPGSQVEGRYTYNSNDYNTAFTTRLYRIKITELSGQISYSPIIKINRDGVVNNMYVVGKNNGCTIYFTNMQPASIRVVNAAGQMIWNSNSSRSQYELSNLLQGVYFVQYELNGSIGVKQFIVP